MRDCLHQDCSHCLSSRWASYPCWMERPRGPLPLAFPTSAQQPARAVVNFDLSPTEQPKLLVPPVQRQHANQTPSKFPGPKQNPVSAVHSAGGRGAGEERLANGPSPPARPTARVNFDLPPVEQPNQPVSPEKILPPSQATNDVFAMRATATPNFDLPPAERPTLLVPPVRRQCANQSLSKFLGPKQDPVSAVHSTGGRGRGGERLVVPRQSPPCLPPTSPARGPHCQHSAGHR
jgi:hypothetical protein